MALVKWSGSGVDQSKPLFPIVANGLDPIVVYTGLFVRVSYGDVEGQVVVQSVVVGVGVGEVELGQRGIDDGEFEILGLKDQPEDDDGDNEKNEGEDGVVEDPEEASEVAPAALPSITHAAS